MSRKQRFSFVHVDFNEHLIVVKGIRDLPSWSVKTSTSGRTSTDPLSVSKLQ